MRRYLNISIVMLLLIGSAFFGASAAFAQNVEFQAVVDQTRITLNDTLILSFMISGGNIDLNATPELPDLEKDFDILQGPTRSTSISIINGKQSASLTLGYALSPKHAGTLTIGAAKVTIDNNTYATKPITIEVTDTPAPGQTPSQAPENGQAPQPDDEASLLYLQAEVDRESAYIGEQMTISFWLYTQLSIAGYEIKQPPNFTGFWIEELQIPQPPKLQYREINGQQYGVALMKRYALFPTTSGELTIDPMVMAFSVNVRRSRDPFDMFNDPFFARTQVELRKSQPVTIRVIPLPEENRPATFNGDVGDFTMAVEASPHVVKQDEPVNVKITIQGTGNIKTVKEPVMALPKSFKKYDTQIKETPFPMQEPLQGEKVFETVIIPGESGAYTLPPVEFSFFDPARRAYQTLHSEPIALSVLPKAQADAPVERRIATKEEIKLLGKDIRFIKTDAPHLKNQGSQWYRSGWLRLAYFLPLPLIGGALLYKRHRDKMMSDISYVRQRGANKRSIQRLKAAHDMMTQGDSKGFYATISSALRQYVGDKLNLPPASLTGDDAFHMLKKRGLDDDTLAALKRCLDACDFARFAPVEATPEEMSAVLKDAEQVIERLAGKKSGRSGKAASAALLVGMLWLSSSVSAATTDELFQQGNSFYEAGKYAEAITAYEQILDSGLHNGYVYYNLGNALLKQNRIGEAILQYERAKRLLPRDEDVAYNLEYAKAATVDTIEQQRSAFERVRSYFTPQETHLFFWASYVLLTACIIAFIFAPRVWKFRLLYVMLIPAFGLLFALILLLLQSSSGSDQAAIVLAQKIEAKTGPGEEYSTVFEIHEGAKVRIQREKAEWFEIKLPNNVIGWVKNTEIERIF